MKLITAYQKIKALDVPIFQTSDFAILLGISNKYGYNLLKQLADENLIAHLRRGVWALKESVDPLMLPDYLTAPMPSYISLQSALYYHGLISQIPSLIYAISIAKTRRYNTPISVYSIHHINPILFSGFDIIGDNTIRMAQPEKALFDFCYLKSTKNKLFYALPEVEIPPSFAWHKLKGYVEKIANKSRQVMVLDLLEQLRSLH